MDHDILLGIFHDLVHCTVVVAHLRRRWLLKTAVPWKLSYKFPLVQYCLPSFLTWNGWVKSLGDFGSGTISPSMISNCTSFHLTKVKQQHHWMHVWNVWWTGRQWISFNLRLWKDRINDFGSLDVVVSWGNPHSRIGLHYIAFSCKDQVCLFPYTIGILFFLIKSAQSGL